MPNYLLTFSRETLRDMPQCLTLKRSVKAKLSKSVSKKSKRRPLGFFKRCKYQISMTFTKVCILYVHS